MAKLTAKQESFIAMMTENEELSRHGFELLLKRADYDQFFDSLQAAGLFDPQHNPAPVPAEEEGYVRIPFWSALNYLAAVARLSGDRNDLTLANKVMAVLRSVMSWRDSDGQARDNYHTAYKFAEILALVPTVAVTNADLEFIPLWLSSRFERMLVSKTLSDNVLTRFLASSSADDLDKAVIVLRRCTAVKWRGARDSNPGEGKPVMATDHFWLQKLIRDHARTFGQKIGAKAAQVLVERIREIFGPRTLPSETYRPAVEDHFQNHAYHEAENCSVEGLRDVLAGWCERNAPAAKAFVEELLKDEQEMLRRIGIYLLGQQMAAWQDLYANFLGPRLFDIGHLHELHNLLSAHFSVFSDTLKAKTVQAIREIPLPNQGTDPPRLLKRIQQRWLSAVVGKGYPPADEWFQALQVDPKVGAPPEHPDFDAYMQTWVGPGATPYSVAELKAFATAHTIVEKLNAFEDPGTWPGPTMDGLESSLEQAARIDPEPFFEVLPDFLRAKRDFQYRLISGLRQAWTATDRDMQKTADWVLGWPKMMAFFEQLVAQPEFTQGLTVDHRTTNGVASAIADCLQDGTRNDARAFDPQLLDRSGALIKTLLEKVKGANEPPEDPMMHTLNSPRGRVIEALFSQALRACRVDQNSTNSHAKAWTDVRPLFETELAKCKNSNFEFSTSCGQYLAQLDYMDASWTKTNISRIFPAEFQSNSRCALEGLAFTSFTRSVYGLLVEPGVIDRALLYDLKGEARRKLVERIAAAYLWGDESLGSPRFAHLFRVGNLEDLETIARVFWTVRGEKLSAEQKQRVVQYWERCVQWSRGLPQPPATLFSLLSMLSCYLNSVEGLERELLETVAPFVYVGHNLYEFVCELQRLVETSPDGVSAVLGKMIEKRIPDYDYKDELKKLLHILVAKGKRQDVISYTERMRLLPGMQEIFDSLTRAKP